MKNILLIIGNGFTIDFLNHYNEYLNNTTDCSETKIDVINLFKYGAKIKNPSNNHPGFLSFKNCPALWTLGARPNQSADDSNALIEEIISCANMFFDFVTDADMRKKRLSMLDDNNSIYLKAYKELLSYLSCLFNEYNTYISDDELIDFINQKNNWGWIEFFKKLKDKDDIKVNIITYNYDIWMERILKNCGINYSISCLDKKVTNWIICKPHGSISFIYKRDMSDSFKINYQIQTDGFHISDLRIKDYDDITNNNFINSIIIPPSGDSDRLKSIAPWASKIKDSAIKLIKKFDEDEKLLVVMCGLSYWHVDRREIDELLININQNAEFVLINPTPPRDLNAVLSSIFKNYILQVSADNLGGILDD